jgi:hypothetical protein
MIKYLTVFMTLIACQAPETETQNTVSRPEYAIVIHGGAGTISRNNMDEAT